MSRADLAVLKNWNSIKAVHPFADTTEQDHRCSLTQDIPFQRSIPNVSREHTIAITSLSHAFSDLGVIPATTSTSSTPPPPLRKEESEDVEDFFTTAKGTANIKNASNSNSSNNITQPTSSGNSNFVRVKTHNNVAGRVYRKNYSHHHHRHHHHHQHQQDVSRRASSCAPSVGGGTNQQIATTTQTGSVANNTSFTGPGSSSGSFIRVSTMAMMNPTATATPAQHHGSLIIVNNNNNIVVAANNKDDPPIREPTKIPALPACVKSTDLKLKFLGELLESRKEESAAEARNRRRVRQYFNLQDSFPFSALISALANEEDDIVKEATASARGNTDSSDEQSSAGVGGLVGLLRSAVSQNKNRFQQDGFDLDLTYITPRIIAMGFPSSGAEAFYRNPMDQVELFFKRRHPQHYRVYNLCSERQYDADKLEGRWKRFPFDDHNAPAPVKLMPSFVADATKFLRDDPKNVVAIHCKAGKGRTGLMVACLLMALVPSLREPSKALHYFASQRTDDAQGVTIASQMRYVQYYGQMLVKHHGEEVLPHRTLALQKIVVWSPIRLSYAPLTQIDNIFFIVEENNEKRLDSLETTLSKSFRTDDGYGGGVHYVFERSGKVPILQKLTGDIKISFYVKTMLGKDELFHYWFNTTMCSPHLETMSKFELDKSCKDSKNQVYCEDLMCQTCFIDAPVRKPQNHRSLIAPPAPKRGKEGVATSNTAASNNAASSPGVGTGQQSSTAGTGNSPPQKESGVLPSSSSSTSGTQLSAPAKQEEKSLFARLFGK